MAPCPQISQHSDEGALFLPTSQGNGREK